MAVELEWGEMDRIGEVETDLDFKEVDMFLVSEVESGFLKVEDKVLLWEWEGMVCIFLEV